MIWILLAAAQAQNGVGLGFTGEMAAEPARPRWDAPPRPTNFICGGIQFRVSDTAHRRFGMTLGGCGGGWGHAMGGHLGFGPGIRTHGRVYAYGDVDFGISFYGIDGPNNNSWGSITAMVRPKAGLGVVFNEAMAMEIGPAIQTGIPFLQFVHNESPNGFYFGHVTFGATFYIGEFNTKR